MVFMIINLDRLEREVAWLMSEIGLVTTIADQLDDTENALQIEVLMRQRCSGHEIDAARAFGQLEQ